MSRAQKALIALGIVVVLGLVIYTVFVAWLHEPLIGVRPFV